MLRSWRFFALIGLVACMLMQPATAAPQGSRDGDRSMHVYLLRGLLNVFSLGLDDLGEKLDRRGIANSVHNHTEYEDIAAQIIGRYRNGWRGPVVLIGHSLGADNVYPLAEILSRSNVPVALIVSFDPVGYQNVPGNVSKAINYYVDGAGYPVSRGRGFRGELANIEMSKKGDYGHLNIEKSAVLHAQVLSRLSGLSGGGRGPRAASAKRSGTQPARSSETTGSIPAATPAAAPATATVVTPAAEPVTRGSTTE